MDIVERMKAMLDAGDAVGGISRVFVPADDVRDLLAEIERLRSLSLEGREPVAWQSRVKYSFCWGVWQNISKEQFEEFSARPGKREIELRQLYASPLLPDGYVMVPREPTPEMALAGINALVKSKKYDVPGVGSFDREMRACNGDVGAVRAMAVYRAMLSASPKQEDSP